LARRRIESMGSLPERDLSGSDDSVRREFMSSADTTHCGSGRIVYADALPWRLLTGGIDAESGVHIGFCGHAIHIQCFQRYFATLITRHDNSDLYEGYNILNLASGEFLCPVCRRMANVAIPIVESDKSDLDVCSTLSMSHADWVRETTTAFEKDGGINMTVSHSASVSAGGDVLTRGVGSCGNAMVSTASLGNRQPVLLERITDEFIRDSALWNHTNGVMMRISSPSSRVDGNDNGDGGSPLPRKPSSLETNLHALCAAVGTTIASAEIASRSGMWDGCNSSRARRLLGTLVRQTRVRTTNIQSTDMRRRSSRDLWKALLRSTTDCGSRDEICRARRVDPFVSVLFLVLLWRRG
jgi:hypothetical protein